MGWKDPPDTYDTIIPEQKRPTKPFNRERVRYVKDPLGETKYAYHINYQPDDSSNTNTFSSSNGVLPRDQQQTPAHAHGTHDSRRVAFGGKEVMGYSSNPQNFYVNEPGMQRGGGSLRSEGEVSIPYDPTSYIADQGFEQENPETQDKSRKRCKDCSAPPWWAWLIIILISALLAAVLYFIFADVLNPTAHVTTDVTTTHPVSNTTVTSQQDVIPTEPPGAGLSTTQALRQQNDVTDDLLSYFRVALRTRSLSSLSANRDLVPADTIAQCLQVCLNQTEVCFGVDFNIQWSTCHTLSHHDYQIEPLGSSPKTNNYRRSFDAKVFDLCRSALTYNYRNAFRSNVAHRAQPTEVNTLKACQQACLGPFGNGVLENGYRCAAAVFDADFRTCKISDVRYDPETLMSSDTSTHVINDGVTCVDDAKAACTVKFSLARDRRPPDLDPGLEQTGVSSVLDCASLCVHFRSAPNVTCQAFVMTYVSRKCTLYTGRGDTALDTAKGQDFYRRNNNNCVRCGNERTGTKLHPACAECDPSEFIATVGTAPTGGKYHRRSDLATCSMVCQEAMSATGRDHCYGFTFNKVTNNCTHFFDFNYELDGIGESPDCIHYRRMFSCHTPTSPCNLYDLSADRAGSAGGVLQPWDVNTPARCRDRCWGYVTATDRSCAGAEFNRRTSRCTVYLDDSYTLEKSPGVDHYRRRDC